MSRLFKQGWVHTNWGQVYYTLGKIGMAPMNFLGEPEDHINGHEFISHALVFFGIVWVTMFLSLTVLVGWGVFELVKLLIQAF